MMLVNLPVYAFVSPGWPPSQNANGIVSYIHNIKQGFENNAEIVVLSNSAETESYEERIYEFHPSLNIKDKLQRKLLTHIHHSYFKHILTKSTWKNVAKAIDQGLSKVPVKLSMIEVEDTFGIAKWLKPLICTPVTTRLHGPFCIHGLLQKTIKGEEYRYRLITEGDAIKISDGLTSPSQDVLDRVREFYDIELKHAKVIHNPILPVDKSQRWNLTNKPNILFVGRFDFHKGGDFVIKAFRIIASADKNVELNFIGADVGIAIDGYYYHFWEYVKKIIKETHILRRINFHGVKSPSEIAVFRRNSTVTLMASRYENFSMALLEALATGCPVISTRVGGNSEIIIDNENGILVEPESPDAIAYAVNILLNDLAMMKQISKNSVSDVEKRFHPNVIASQTFDYYQKIK